MDFRNLVHLHRVQAERLGPRIAIRHKKLGIFHDFTWAAYREQALACASALVSAAIQPGDRVGLLAENRLEWLIADMGIMAAGAVNVPPHAPLTAEQVRYQFADAGVRWLFVSNEQQMQKIRAVRSELPELQGVVIFEHMPASDDCQSWNGFLHRGRQSLVDHMPELKQREQALDADSMATVMYTSGTTGEPKGVMLTHGNLLSNAVAVNESCPRKPDSIFLNWLPFSHIYARTVDHYLCIAAAVTLCLAESAETVVANLAEIHPTHMSCVPRFYEKLLDAVASDKFEITKKKLQYIFGPRMEWLTSGGAPLPFAIAKKYLDAGLLVLQGYGLTESSPVISFNRPDAYKLGTVGQAIPGVEIKIAGDGEVLTRGPHVMPGYWNNQAATDEAIRDGWLCTGDLGNLDNEGFLSITGRKKELLVLSSGKKVVPSYIEGLILDDPFIDQVVVHGEGKNYLTALVVPNWENLKQELDKRNQSTGVEELANQAGTIELLQKRIEQRLTDVSSWEHVKRIAVMAKPFTVEGDEMTVSLKLRRNVIFEKYEAELERLYGSGE